MNVMSLRWRKKNQYLFEMKAIKFTINKPLAQERRWHRNQNDSGQVSTRGIKPIDYRNNYHRHVSWKVWWLFTSSILIIGSFSLANNDGALLGIATAEDVEETLNPQLFGAIASNLWKNFEESVKYADRMEFQFVHVEVSQNHVFNNFIP